MNNSANNTNNKTLPEEFRHKHERGTGVTWSHLVSVVTSLGLLAETSRDAEPNTALKHLGADVNLSFSSQQLLGSKLKHRAGRVWV